MKRSKQLIVELIVVMMLVLSPAVYGGMSADDDSEWTPIMRARAHVDTKLSRFFFTNGFHF